MEVTLHPGMTIAFIIGAIAAIVAAIWLVFKHFSN
jgi:hypothetical protein